MQVLRNISSIGLLSSAHLYKLHVPFNLANIFPKIIFLSMHLLL